MAQNNISSPWKMENETCPKCGNGHSITAKYQPTGEYIKCPGRICWFCNHTWNIEGQKMAPNEEMSTIKIIYRIVDNETGEITGSYSRSYRDEYDFGSVDAARNANCHGMFKDRKKYRIAKYRVIETLIESDAEEENPT